MNIGVITVTYGNRFNYLTKLVERLIILGIRDICVVVNGSPKYLFSDLIKNNKVNFIFNNDNLGSAKGFKQGIKFLSSKSNIEFIWLLDDDNIPELNALDNILKFLEFNVFDFKKDALLSFRPDRKKFLKAVHKNNGSYMLKGKNSALGFSIFEKRQFTNYIRKGLKVAPYGGFYFHKQLIDHIGYPDESYFLYGDDYDFTIRVSENGGMIRLVKNSIVNDLEVSFHLKGRNKFRFFRTRYHNTDNLDRIFYSVRNGIRFELKHMVKNKIIYYFNLFVYSSIIGVLLVFNLQKFVIFYKGVFLGILNKS